MNIYSASISLGCAVLLSACVIVNPNPGERKSDSYWARGDYAEAIEITKPRAELGDPWAQLRMGIYYDTGQGVPRDLRQAVDWYKKVAAQMAEGQWAEGKVILNEEEERGEKGHFGQRKDALIAQWRLANIYYEENGVGRDLQQAFALIESVSKATQGDSIYFCCKKTTLPVLPGDGGRDGPSVMERKTKGRWVTAKMIADTLSKVKDAMAAEKLAGGPEASEAESP
jgi:TPR repeat protein